MSLYWLLFISLTVLGGVTYNVGMKLGTANMNVFAFALVISSTVLVIEAVCFLTAKYAFKVDVSQGVDMQNAKFAVMVGAGGALVDFAYFLALRHGSVIASQIFWMIGGMVATALAAIFLFHEAMTPTKILGIFFGIVSVVLITLKP